MERIIIGHLVRHGLHQGRYIGLAKTLFQALRSAAAVNMHRLMTLICARDGSEALSLTYAGDRASQKCERHRGGCRLS